jgi:hypothetical protein
MTMSLKPIDVFGLDWPQGNKDKDNLQRANTAMNVLGYLPLISPIVGIARAIFALLGHFNERKFTAEYTATQCARAFSEFCGVGLLLMIVDLAVEVLFPLQSQQRL